VSFSPDEKVGLQVIAHIPSDRRLAEATLDVVSALTNLGYDGRAAETAVAEGKRAVGVAGFEKLLKAALQALSAPKGRAAGGS
jgi:Holliday junction resolvasome RuvABC DNA-binding subunit